jgi:hypothetical protein
MPDDRTISKKIPKDYPTSPDIEDRRYEHAEEQTPGIQVVREPQPSYDMAHKARKKN